MRLIAVTDLSIAHTTMNQHHPRSRPSLEIRGKGLRERGFNLIELMVGLAILAMVMFVAIPGMTTWMRNSQIRAATESIQGGLQSARAEAVRRNTNVEFVLTSLASAGTASDWRVRCAVGSASATCPGLGQGADGPGVTYIEQGLNNESSPHAVVSVTPAATTTITFNGTGRITPLPAGNIQIDVAHDTNACISAGGDARCLRLILAPGGQARMCDPSLPSPPANPRGC